MPTTTTVRPITRSPATAVHLFPCSPIHLYQTLQPGQSSSKVILPGRTLLLPLGDYDFTNMHNGQRCKWFVHIKGMLSLIYRTLQR